MKARHRRNNNQKTRYARVEAKDDHDGFGWMRATPTALSCNSVKCRVTTQVNLCDIGYVS